MYRQLSVSAPLVAAWCLLSALPAGVRAAEPSDAPNDGKVYVIRNINSGKRLAIADGSEDPKAKLVQDDAEKAHTTWKLEAAGDGSFLIVNHKCGLVLKVPENSKDAGVQIEQRKPDDGVDQAWEFVKVGDYYAIRSQHSKLVLDVADASKDNGAAVNQFPLYEQVRHSNQLWSLAEVKKK